MPNIKPVAKHIETIYVMKTEISCFAMTTKTRVQLSLMLNVIQGQRGRKQPLHMIYHCRLIAVEEETRSERQHLEKSRCEICLIDRKRETNSQVKTEGHREKHFIKIHCNAFSLASQHKRHEEQCEICSLLHHLTFMSAAYPDFKWLTLEGRMDLGDHFIMWTHKSV